MKIKHCLSGAVLKHTAMLCMLADHINKVLLAPIITEEAMLWIRVVHAVLAVVGRFAYPIFFFLLVEGFQNTGNRWKYLRNLMLFAFVSEVPFDLFVCSNWLCWEAQNIFFTLALSLAVIWGIDTLKVRVKYWYYLVIPIVLIGCLLGKYGRFDYGSRGILIPLAFYLFRSRLPMASLVGCVVSVRDIWSLPAFWVPCLYNGQRGKQCKWLNYWFYPLHLLLLSMVRVFV